MIHIATEFSTPVESMSHGSIVGGSSEQSVEPNHRRFANDKDLSIVVRRGEIVVSGDTWSLKTDQFIINCVFSQPFIVVIFTYATCWKPQEQVTYYKLSEGCPGNVGKAIFAASYSRDDRGRDLMCPCFSNASTKYRSVSTTTFSSSTFNTSIKTPIPPGSIVTKRKSSYQSLRQRSKIAQVCLVKSFTILQNLVFLIDHWRASLRRSPFLGVCHIDLAY